MLCCQWQCSNVCVNMNSQCRNWVKKKIRQKKTEHQHRICLGIFLHALYTRMQSDAVCNFRINKFLHGPSLNIIDSLKTAVSDRKKNPIKYAAFHTRIQQYSYAGAFISLPFWLLFYYAWRSFSLINSFLCASLSFAFFFIA